MHPENEDAHHDKAGSLQVSVLVRTMDVFIQDPIVDWVESCTSKRQEVGEDEDEDGAGDGEGGARGGAVQWEPSRRIRNARRKLQGSNPIDIILDDLKQVMGFLWVTFFYRAFN